MQRLNEVVLDSNGKPLGAAVILVRPTGGTSTSLIYSDIAGTGSKANPITADSLGRFWFYAANDRYDLIVTATGIGTATVVDVMMEDVPRSNLNELTTDSSARDNIGLGSIATYSTSSFLQTANNLSDLAAATTARANLGVLSTASNLGDVASAATARANLGLAIGTDVQAFDATIPKTTSTQSWTKAQRGAVVALTSTVSSVAVDLSLANNFSLTMTEQTTFAAPTNVVLGQGGSVVISRGTAAYSAAWNSFYKWPSAFGTGTLTTATGSVDMMVYHVYSTSAAACQMINNLA